MERLVEIKLKKVHILSILDCYYRLFPLIYISYDSGGMTIHKGQVSSEGFWLLRPFPEILLRVTSFEANLWF